MREGKKEGERRIKERNIQSLCLMMSNTSYFGTGMQNIEVLPGIGVQRLVLHPEMECTNFFPHWDFGNHFLKIEANLHIKCPDRSFLKSKRGISNRIHSKCAENLNPKQILSYFIHSYTAPSS